MASSGGVQGNVVVVGAGAGGGGGGGGGENCGVANENVEGSSCPGIPGASPRNPLICGVCQDYYSDPCLLSCYHSFCSRCLRGPHLDGKLTCPICRQVTQLKEGMQQPPSDVLIRQLVEFANCENPPCANCDKRDKTTMYFCTTCGMCALAALLYFLSSFFH